MFPSRPYQLIPAGLTPVDICHSIRSLVDRRYLAAPAIIQQLYLCGYSTRLYLNISRGEPAISVFDWHIAPNHKSSHRISPQTGTVLPLTFREGSTCSWLAHTVSGLSRTRFMTPYSDSVSLCLPTISGQTRINDNSLTHSSIGTTSLVRSTRIHNLQSTICK